MITFIICVKHPDNCHSYYNTWKLLENTLDSVCNQTDKDYNVIVVSNKTLRRRNGIKFIELNWSAPTLDDWQMSDDLKDRSNSKQMTNIRIDRGTKYIIGLKEARKRGLLSHFVMFVDADDFIHQDIARFVKNNLEFDMIRVFIGLKLGINNTFKFRKRFNYICGTCNIINIQLISSRINFSLIDEKDQSTVLQCVDEYYLKMIIGSHKWMYKFFVEDRGNYGTDIPFPAVVYNCSHNEQHSGTPDEVHDLVLSKKQIKEFNIKYI